MAGEHERPHHYLALIPLSPSALIPNPTKLCLLSRLPVNPYTPRPLDPERPLHRKGGLGPFSAPQWHFSLPGHAADYVGAPPRGGTDDVQFPARHISAWAVALFTGDPPEGDRGKIVKGDPPD